MKPRLVYILILVLLIFVKCRYLCFDTEHILKSRFTICHHQSSVSGMEWLKQHRSIQCGKILASKCQRTSSRALFSMSVMVLLALQCGDIELNPGPTNGTELNSNEFQFYPVSSECQTSLCSMLNLPLFKTSGKRDVKPLKNPSQVFDIVGDGNCLFRAFSYVICGTQKFHEIIRNRITSYMKEIQRHLHPHINSSVDEFLNYSRMRLTGTWGTDIEIITAAHLFQTYFFFVYSNFGMELKWLRFSAKKNWQFDEHCKEAMYIQNINGVHYDVLLDVVIDVNNVAQRNYPDISGDSGIFEERYGYDTADGRLRERLARQGLEPVDVAGDGNCFFRAVSHQLFSTDEHHHQVRTGAINYMIQNPEIFIESIAEDSFLTYITAMSRSGTWCDNAVIQAVANANNCQIFITESATNFQEQTVITPQSSGCVPSQIHIGHLEEIHYVSTKKIRKRNSHSRDMGPLFKKQKRAQQESTRIQKLRQNPVFKQH